ncbi:alpha-1,2-fucosyltransferase [Rothia sp. P13129]|uniref:alpha-1,2-fucosyltransferase n=1 Tax=Rothia sp. P13129 TaxID=3402664 RepID=UPI003ACD2F66
MSTEEENERISSYTKRNTGLAKAQNVVKYRTRQVIAKCISVVRTGPEKVYLIPRIARGGNWLYEWMKAHAEHHETGNDVYVAQMPGMDVWLEEFPLLKDFTLDAQKIRFRSLREIGMHQRIREQFTEEQIQRFVHEVLLSSEHFQQKIAHAQKYVGEDTLVINVRRGDYYSHAHIHKNFGIDTVAYLREATQHMLKVHAPSNILVTSDDTQWCAEHLGFLEDIAPTQFEKIGYGMFGDFAALAVSRHIILTNTTFGYWGAYVATVRQNAQVWAPNVHELEQKIDHRTSQAPFQHLQSWTAVTPTDGYHSWLESER